MLSIKEYFIPSTEDISQVDNYNPIIPYLHKLGFFKSLPEIKIIIKIVTSCRNIIPLKERYLLILLKFSLRLHLCVT